MDPEMRKLREEVRAQLTGEGGPFELVREPVLGETMSVFKNRSRSLRELLETAGAHGDREYLVEGERRITYAQLGPIVASIAAGLRERYGVGPGDRVAILAPNCVQWPLAFWATVSLGGIVSAMNGMWTADEIGYAIGHSKPSLLIGDRKRLARLDGDPGVPTLEIESEWAALEDHAPGTASPSVAIDEDDPAVILYTSGTTGRPKGALGSHRGILGLIQTSMFSGAEDMVAAMKAGTAPAGAGGERPQPIILATSPMFHMSGLYATIVLQASFGGKLVIHPGRFDPDSILGLMEREKISAFAALGSMGPRLAKHPRLGNYDVSSVVNVGFGGAPASPAVQDLMRGAFPNASHALGIGYGSSETVAVVAAIRGAEYAEVPESTGRIVPTHEVEIRDESGTPQPEGVEGEIFVRSPYLMLRYWDNPEASEGTLRPGRWLATGDVGRLEGGYLYINSRARDMILRNAENIYPVEIEYRLDRHPQVRESAVFGVEHEEWGQEVKAVVVVEPGEVLAEDALAAHCKETLAAYKVPTLWELRAEPLPRNPSGKVLKNVLAGQTASRFVEE